MEGHPGLSLVRILEYLSLLLLYACICSIWFGEILKSSGGVGCAIGVNFYLVHRMAVSVMQSASVSIRC